MPACWRRAVWCCGPCQSSGTARGPCFAVRRARAARRTARGCQTRSPLELPLTVRRCNRMCLCPVCVCGCVMIAAPVAAPELRGSACARGCARGHALWMCVCPCGCACGCQAAPLELRPALGCACGCACVRACGSCTRWFGYSQDTITNCRDVPTLHPERSLGCPRHDGAGGPGPGLRLHIGRGLPVQWLQRRFVRMHGSAISYILVLCQRLLD